MAVYRVGKKFRGAIRKDKYGFKYSEWWAVYKCQCGSRFVMQCRTEQKTQSCGCAARESARRLLLGNRYRRKHNMTLSRTYKSWSRMRQRCKNSAYPEFHLYGGRGITVCDRWDDFDAFLKDMGERPVGCSLDRIDPNGNYEPLNCRWASPKQQARNTRRNVLVSIDGVEKTVAEWAESFGAAKDKTIYKRLKAGWSGRDAVFGKSK